MRRDAALVFPGVDVSSVVAVPTAQRSAVDLVDWGPAAAAEKDLLLERFAAWAAAVCDALTAGGWWADYIDPCSGLPVRTAAGAAVWPEVDAAEALLKWRTTSAGGCRIAAHPAWGTAVYPASLFTAAPAEAVVAAAADAAAAVPVKPRAGGGEAGDGGGGGAPCCA
jgi:hypothetical protein